MGPTQCERTCNITQVVALAIAKPKGITRPHEADSTAKPRVQSSSLGGPNWRCAGKMEMVYTVRKGGLGTRWLGWSLNGMGGVHACGWGSRWDCGSVALGLEPCVRSGVSARSGPHYPSLGYRCSVTVSVRHGRRGSP